MLRNRLHEPATATGRLYTPRHGRISEEYTSDLLIVKQRDTSSLLIGAVCVVLAGLVAYAIISSPNLKWNRVFEYFFSEPILQGLVVTLLLTVVCIVVGALIGSVFAVWQMGRSPVLAMISRLYVWFFRGVPLLVLIIFLFNFALFVPRIGWGELSVSTNDVITPLAAAFIALSLHQGAYMAEIIRAGYLSVDGGQREAALALGMTNRKLMHVVIRPQAIRVILPPAGNEAISLLKATSLVSVIGARDLMTNAQIIYTGNFLVIELLIVVVTWYLILVTLASILQSRLERWAAHGTSISLRKTKR